MAPAFPPPPHHPVRTRLPTPPVHLPAPAPASSHQGHKRGRAPASRKAILGLLQEVTTGYSSEECSICLQDFHRADPEVETPLRAMRPMPCSHAFHQHCILGWLRCNPVCPLCRHQLPIATEEEEQELPIATEKRQEQGRRTRRGRVSAYYYEDEQDFIQRYIDHAGIDDQRESWG
ncbi:hypothetical protein BAE44_0022062 [Dichanthelium oligosanthes]|uniref:RING-type domain-containing protein n=1 Tax=Dichanthelium oligosanthes TaxID=888268 RepID=A0A1E5UVK3_9POAL|nr:hypothetical protein BAE44_0022062 [Dichanthelium oligosanthes]